MRRGRTVLAAQHPMLGALSARDEAALDLLVAHIVSVLNADRADITDAAELQVLGRLLLRA